MGTNAVSKWPGVVLGACVMLAAPLAMGQTVDKAGLHAELVTLHDQIATLKGVNQPAQLAAALARCAEITAQLGGDQPVASGNAPANGGTAPAGATGSTPPNCVATTTTVTNNTPVTIVDVATVTSSIVVSGAGTFLWDADLTANITHTFAADLDITLTSPAGTVVTITTDNGAGNDDVFAGTTWSDQSNPSGQVPYTSNNGLTTDQAYANATVATPLVPEGAFGAFIGENPNGTWTLTVTDDLTGDVGTVSSWGLTLRTFPAAPTTTTTTVTNNTPVAVVDVGVATSTLAVAGAGTSICDVRLTTNLEHTFAADLDVTLQSPAGTVVTLTTDNGAGNDNVFAGTLWSDNAATPATDNVYANLVTASSLVPEEAMAAFAGQNPNGTWTVTISDDLSGDTGTLQSWSLAVDTCSCALPDADLSLAMTASGPANPAPGDLITYSMTAANAGPAAATGVAVTMQTGVLMTHVSNTCAATVAGGTITWNVGNLAVGGNASCTVVGRVVGAGQFNVSASIAGAQTDPVSTNNAVTLGTISAARGVPVNAPWALILLAAAMALIALLGMRRRAVPL